MNRWALAFGIFCVASCGEGSNAANEAIPPATNLNPVAVVTASSQTMDEQRIPLHADASSDADGEIVSYLWELSIMTPNEFELSSKTDANVELVVGNLAKNMQIEVILTVTDDDGATGSDTVPIEIEAIEGPDTDDNGIRDDLDALISQNYSFSSTELEFAQEIVRRHQRLLEGARMPAELLREEVSGATLAAICLDVSSPDILERFLADTQLALLDTSRRISAYEEFEDALATLGPISLPDDDTIQENCL